MSTHIVMWNFKPDVKEERKEELKAEMKRSLEALLGQVPGLLSVSFLTAPGAGSTHEMALVTTHETFADIAVYGAHSAHVKAADTYVRPYTCDRACLNF